MAGPEPIERDIAPVVVTGTRSARLLKDSPVQTVVISSRQIRQAAATSPVEALQDNIPGVTVTPNAMGNNLRIKGLNSRYILFLVDGERLPAEGAGGNINLDQVDVGSLRRIEVVDGASSALYGSAAVGAVINLITEDPFSGIAVGQSVASHRTLRSRVSGGFQGRRFSIAANGFRHSSDGFGEGVAARYADYGAGLKTAFGETLSLNARWFRHETFNPAGSMNTAHPLAHNLSAGLNGGHTWGAHTVRASLRTDRYFDYDYREQARRRSPLKNSASISSARITETWKAVKAWEVVAGAEFNHEQNYATTTLGAAPARRAVDESAVFAQASGSFRVAELVAGVRGTWNSSFGAALTPKISALLRADRVTLRADVGTAFRAPSIKELYYDFDHQGMFHVYGNPLLRPERGLYLSASAEWRGYSATIYHNRISNKITQYDVLSPSGAAEKHYRNVRSAVLRGVDISACQSVGRVVLKASYSFCDALDHSTGRQIEGNIRHSATASVAWQPRWFSLLAAGRFGAPTLYYAGDELRQSRPLQVYKLVLSRTFHIGAHELEGVFKIENVLGFRDPSFIDPGRQYLFGINYKFKSNKP